MSNSIVELFLQGIEDPECSEVKTHLQTTRQSKLDKCIEAFKRRAGDLHKERSQRKSLKVLARRQKGSKRDRADDLDDDESVQRGNKSRKIGNGARTKLTGEHCINKDGLLFLQKNECKKLCKEHKKFIHECNLHVRKKKDLSDLAAPKGLKILPKE